MTETALMNWAQLMYIHLLYSPDDNRHEGENTFLVMMVSMFPFVLWFAVLICDNCMSNLECLSGLELVRSCGKIVLLQQVILASILSSEAII
jgi:hypothetical protein